MKKYHGVPRIAQRCTTNTKRCTVNNKSKRNLVNFTVHRTQGVKK